MGFLVGVGALQFAYCVLVGNYVGGFFSFFLSFFSFLHHLLLLAICVVVLDLVMGRGSDGWMCDGRRGEERREEIGRDGTIARNEERRKEGGPLCSTSTHPNPHSPSTCNIQTTS